MKDEIKEYLDYFKKYATISEKAILEDIEDYITNLQEAIETIKNTNKLLIQQKAQLQDDLDMLDNRIDKAIEYIKEDMYVEPNELYGLVDGEHLLNILQGKSDE